MGLLDDIMGGLDLGGDVADLPSNLADITEMGFDPGEIMFLDTDTGSVVDSFGNNLDLMYPDSGESMWEGEGPSPASPEEIERTRAFNADAGGSSWWNKLGQGLSNLVKSFASGNLGRGSGLGSLGGGGGGGGLPAMPDLPGASLGGF